jgi:hypothetical protein
MSAFAHWLPLVRVRCLCDGATLPRCYTTHTVDQSVFWSLVFHRFREGPLQDFKITSRFFC